MTDLLPPTNGRTPEARLLVVDDEPNIVELLSTSLRFAGFEVATAMNGNDAVRAVERHRPDLVLLDVMLPDVDGFVVLRRLRDGREHLPVLFLTARDGNDDKVTGLTLGGDDYVTKPFSLEEVVARIRAVLRRTQAVPTHRAPPRRGRSRARRGEPRGVAGRARGLPVPHRVQPAALPHGQRGAGAVEGADPRPRVELRLRRRRQHRRVVHLATCAASSTTASRSSTRCAASATCSGLPVATTEGGRVGVIRAWRRTPLWLRLISAMLLPGRAGPDAHRGVRRAAAAQLPGRPGGRAARRRRPPDREPERCRSREAAVASAEPVRPDVLDADGDASADRGRRR